MDKDIKSTVGAEKTARKRSGPKRKVEGVPSKKDQLIEALLKHSFNIAKACKEVDIARNNYYSYMKDPEFANKLRMGKSVMRGILSNAIMEGVESGDLDLRYKYLSLIPSGKVAEILEIQEEGDDSGLAGITGTVTFK